MKNDLLLRLDVVTELNRALPADSVAIGVEVHHGTVKLAGHVSNSSSRITAERAAHRVAGVTMVVMDLDVIPSAETNRRGANLAA
jgi:osmotically-inducible protein OsmY